MTEDFSNEDEFTTDEEMNEAPSNPFDAGDLFSEEIATPEITGPKVTLMATGRADQFLALEADDTVGSILTHNKIVLVAASEYYLNNTRCELSATLNDGDTIMVLANMKAGK